MSYDSETEAAGRHDAALARAEAWQAQYEVERLAERIFLDAEQAARRRAVVARFLGTRLPHPLTAEVRRPRSRDTPDSQHPQEYHKMTTTRMTTTTVKHRLVFVLLVLALVASTVVLMAGRAGAHTNTYNAATCEGVAGGFESFPDGTNTIGIAGDDGTPVDKTFTGTSGPVTATWAELGVNVNVLGGALHVYDFYWNVEGERHAGPFTFDAAECVPPLPPEPPLDPTPVLIPPMVIERSEAAVPVVAATLPFTG